MSTYSRSYTYEDEVEEILFGSSRKAPVVTAAAGTSQNSSANATLQEVSAAPSRRRRLPLWLERCAAEGPAKKSTSTPEADALTNVGVGDFYSFGGGTQLWTQWTSFERDSREDVAISDSPSISILQPHQPPAPVSDNDAVGEFEVDYTALKSVTTSLDGSTPSRSTPPHLSPYVCSDEDDTEPPGTTCSSLEEPREEEEISASPASAPVDEDEDVKNQRAEDVDMPAPAPTPAAVWLDCHRCRGKRCVLATGYCSVCGARSSLWQNCTSCKHTRCVLLFCAMAGERVAMVELASDQLNTYQHYLRLHVACRYLTSS